MIFGILGLACSLVLLPGCGAQPGTTVVTQSTMADPVLQKAIQGGTYKLYTEMSPNPTATVKLQAGDPLGFKRENGKWMAVAGDQTFDLPGGTAGALWKLQDAK
jgi:hypothetical protein